MRYLRCRGFSLLELLVVIAILGVLAMLMFPVFERAKRSAKITRSISGMRQIHLATMIYQTEWSEGGGSGAASSLGLPSDLNQATDPASLKLPWSFWKTTCNFFSPLGKGLKVYNFMWIAGDDPEFAEDIERYGTAMILVMDLTCGNEYWSAVTLRQDFPKRLYGVTIEGNVKNVNNPGEYWRGSTWYPNW